MESILKRADAIGLEKRLINVIASRLQGMALRDFDQTWSKYVKIDNEKKMIIFNNVRYNSDDNSYNIKREHSIVGTYIEKYLHIFVSSINEAFNYLNIDNNSIYRTYKYGFRMETGDYLCIHEDETTGDFSLKLY